MSNWSTRTMAAVRNPLTLLTGGSANASPAPAKRHVLILGTGGDIAAIFERLPDAPSVFTVTGDAPRVGEVG
jgi:hypothetical protein